MKALSVRQPWASLIASGQKTIETRTWPTKYRGPILIVASAKKHGDLPVGCSLCIADLVDCRPMKRSDKKAACCDWYDGFSWVLENIRPVDQMPIKGRLGIYEVKYDA